jgi:hypothetical protein
MYDFDINDAQLATEIKYIALDLEEMKARVLSREMKLIAYKQEQTRRRMLNTKVYILRRAITNASEATEQGERVSAWTSFNGASSEQMRLWTEKGIETSISIEYL